ncbi:MAG: SprT family zinc-dependent metalloprotease [Anaerococcus sp.]|nr:SprT family zinc-dependent metalloprotease [Peptoniphilaceae bacterium]MDY3055014.1 SprT family zinc-dependent metalloprotease [Anaerococcus sp.]
MKRKYLQVEGLRLRLDKRKTYKNIRIRVIPPHGDLAATCPEYISDKMIKAFVKKNIDQIKKTIAQQEKSYGYLIQTYEEGSTCRIFGKVYKLRLEKSQNNRAYIKDENLFIKLKDVDSIEERKKHLDSFLRKILREKTELVIGKYEKEMELKVSGFTIRKMKTKWGSCNIDKKHININLDLVRHKIEALEYIVVHELCHLKESGHGKKFYELVKKYYPDYKRVEVYLDSQMISG